MNKVKRWIKAQGQCGCGQKIKVSSPVVEGKVDLKCGKCGANLIITFEEGVNEGKAALGSTMFMTEKGTIAVSYIQITRKVIG